MKNISEVIKDINDYYGCEFATESFNKGRNTIYLDIPSVITTSLSEDSLNQLYKTENVVNTLKELLPALKFFNSKDIIQKKEEFKGDVQYSSKLNNNKADNGLAINVMGNKSNDINIENGIKILNSLFQKKYIVNSKRGVIFNGVANMHKYPFPETITNEIIKIQSKEDANKVVQMLLEMPKYAICEKYLDKSNDMKSNENKVVIEYDDYNKFTPLLEHVNKWLNNKLYIDTDGQIAYDVEVKLSKKQQKKQKRKTNIEIQVLPNELVECFKNITADEDTMAFLIELYEFNAAIFSRKPSKIFREKIYLKKHGFVDDYGLLNVLRGMNKRFKTPQILIADELKLKEKYMVADATVIKMLDIQKKEDIPQDEKIDLIFEIIESLNVIKSKEYKFYGGKEMLDLETTILNKALSMVSKYYDMLNNLTLKEIKSTFKYYKQIDIVIDVIAVEELKRKFNDDCVETIYNRYKDIIEIRHPLFNVMFAKKDLNFNGDIYNKVITINNKLCQDITNIYMLNKRNVFEIMYECRNVIKTTIESNAQEIIDTLKNEDKYNNIEIDMFDYELINDIYSSKLKCNVNALYYDDNEYKLDSFDNELLKQELSNRIKQDIKEHQEMLLKYKKLYWDRELKAKTEAYNIQDIKEYATIVYLVGNERNKGITTYTNILLGSKSEYADNSVYGALKHLKSNKINSMIEELIDLNVLDRANKKASFGRYIAIVKGGYYNENIAAKFQDGKFIGEDVVVNSDKKYVDAKNVVSQMSTMEFIKTLKDMDLTIINKNNINVTGLDIKDIQEFGDIICEDKRFYNKNWEIVSNIIPPLSDQVIMFLKLKSINNNDGLKNIIEIEEKKRKG